MPIEECAPGSIRFIDAIEYNGNIKRLKDAIMYIGGRKVVCENIQAAKRLRVNGYKEIITLDGEVLKQGVIAGGSNEALMGLEFQVKDADKKFQEANANLENLKTEIAEIKKGQFDINLIEAKEKQTNLGNEISELEKKLESAGKENEILEKTSQEISHKLKLEEAEIKLIEESIEKTQKEIEEIKKRNSRSRESFICRILHKMEHFKHCRI